jgi:hypothetical protein
MIYAKGSVLKATLDFIEHDAGRPALTSVLANLPGDTRALVEGATATDEVPLTPVLELWHAADGVLGGADPAWMERAGAYSIDSLGVQLYGGILRKPTPREFLTQRVSLFRLFYHTGEMEVVEQEPGRAVLRLVNFAEGDPLFCRRQTGGLRRALELAGGQDAIARHVRCVHQGDAFCEWDLRWKE